MQANSTFHVREYSYQPDKIEKSNMLFSMLKGGMRFVTGLIGQRNKAAFKLSTPNSTIGIRGTEFMIAMVNNSMYSQVVSGSIGLTNAAGTPALGAGQAAVVTSATTLATVVHFCIACRHVHSTRRHPCSTCDPCSSTGSRWRINRSRRCGRGGYPGGASRSGGRDGNGYIGNSGRDWRRCRGGCRRSRKQHDHDDPSLIPSVRFPQDVFPAGFFFGARAGAPQEKVRPKGRT